MRYSKQTQLKQFTASPYSVLRKHSKPLGGVAVGLKDYIGWMLETACGSLLREEHAL